MQANNTHTHSETCQGGACTVEVRGQQARIGSFHRVNPSDQTHVTRFTTGTLAHCHLPALKPEVLDD